jgi:prepilin peptidase CpaA
MPILDVVRYAIAAGFSLVLLWAATTDIVSRIIPNRAVLALVGLFVLWALVGKGVSLGPDLLAGAIALAVGYLFYAFKVMGGGDAKLFAATALFTGLGYLPALALMTVLAGGVIAAVMLATRPRRAVAMLTMRGKGDFGRGVPYGVAIAIGGVYVFWGAMLGNLAPYSLPWAA